MRSHPVWVCGLKLMMFLTRYFQFCHTLYGCVDWNSNLVAQLHVCLVTPCMGVWIETYTTARLKKWRWVTPCMGVWIETRLLRPWSRTWSVTPCMGVWIETSSSSKPSKLNEVTPCMGVWIETDYEYQNEVVEDESHPVWVCGLKLSRCLHHEPQG